MAKITNNDTREKQMLTRETLTYYLMHHIKAADEESCKSQASVIVWLYENQFSFSYDEYVLVCEKAGTANAHKQMLMFEVIITKADSSYGYIVKQSHLIDGQDLTTVHDGMVKVFVMRLLAYDRGHAYEQATAIAKENNI